MTFGSEWRSNSGVKHHRVPRRARPQRVLGGAALGCVALSCVWTICVNLGGSGTGQSDLAGDGADQVEIAATRGDKLVTAKPRPAAPSNTYGFLFDPRPSLGLPPGTFVKTAALQAAAQAAPAQPPVQNMQEIPAVPPGGDRVAQSAAPPPPQHQVSQIRTALLRESAHAAAVASKPADAPSIFEKLFGRASPLALAYAAPDAGGLTDGQNIVSGRYDRSTAVYDISAHTVYMPDGTQLEAHSGYGSMLDDPRYAAEKDRGVTPPDVYDLEPREALFHGVRALRLIPEDEGKVFGRTGLLAHSFMLGPNGASNGCVSFRNYDAFLQAFDDQRIKRLVVVTRLE